MIAEIKRLTVEYHKWLRDRIVLKQLEDWVEITAPYLDRHNDYLQVYTQSVADGYLITDDGYTISDLEMCGCPLDSPTRKRFLAETLNGFGVHLEEKELRVTATSQDFAVKQHNLFQAMLAVNDLYVLSRTSVASAFIDDVAAWLNSANIMYQRNYEVVGQSGLDYEFDFLVPASSTHPPQLLITINKPSRADLERTICAWTDSKAVLDQNTRGYVIFNDQDNRIPSKHESALKRIGIKPWRWSNRDEMLAKVA